MIVDNFGNTASITGIETYSCDFESHMTQREASGGSTDTHEYDGDGRRVRSNLDDAADWTHFIHDELTENLICEYTLISGTFTIKALNTYGLCLISSNRQGTIRYFHFDGLGTTYHLTDTSQTVTDSYSYDAFGVPISATGSSINPYRYVGQWGYYDDGAMGSSSEMLLLGIRYYWPRYARFSVWDRLPDYNRYAYCANAVSMLADMNGRQPAEPGSAYGGAANRAWKIFGKRRAMYAGWGFLLKCVYDVIYKGYSNNWSSEAIFNACVGCCEDAFEAAGAGIGSRSPRPLLGALVCGLGGYMIGSVACPSICSNLLGYRPAVGAGCSGELPPRPWPRPYSGHGCCCDCGYGNPIECSCNAGHSACRIIRNSPCNFLTSQVQQ
jgi:RHS repeat-associated protein